MYVCKKKVFYSPRRLKFVSYTTLPMNKTLQWLLPAVQGRHIYTEINFLEKCVTLNCEKLRKTMKINFLIKLFDDKGNAYCFI